MDDKDMIYEQQQVELEVTRREDLERKTEFGRELTFLVLLVIFCLALLGMSIRLWTPDFKANSPGMYPGLASIGMLLCCTAAMIQLFAKKRKLEVWEEQGAWNRLKLSIGTEIPFVVLIMIGFTILYVAAISVIGFYISTFAYLAFSIFFLFKGKREKLRQSLLVSAGTILAVYLIIEKLFQIRMP